MDKIYAVLRDSDAHEPLTVMSVWTTKGKAETEKKRLNNLSGHEENEVKEWTLDIKGDMINF